MPQTVWTLITMMAAIGAGASLALQQVLNARLRVELASPWWAGFVSYGVGMLTMLAAVLIAGEPRLTLAAVTRGPLIIWSGGFFGAIFVGTAILAVPRLGAAAVLTFVVVGQMIAAMVFDQIGLLGLVQQPITPVRLMGGVLLIFGAVAMRL